MNRQGGSNDPETDLIFIDANHASHLSHPKPLSQLSTHSIHARVLNSGQEDTFVTGHEATE
jgi:hypothetical protein